MLKTQIIGNVGTSAEVKVLNNGLQVIVFSVAYTYKTKNEEKTTWIRCKKFVQEGKTAALADYIHKGDKIFVEGRPEVSAYLGKDGTAQASFELVANEIQLLSKRTEATAAAPRTDANQKDKFAESNDLPF